MYTAASIHLRQNKAEPAEDALPAKIFRQEFFVAEAVLEREQHRLVVQERRNQPEEIQVRRGLDRDQNEIARADRFGERAVIDRG